MVNKTVLFGGENLRNEFEKLEKKLPPSLESEIYKQRRLDMCDRIFESIVYDLKLLIKQFDRESLNAETFLKELERIISHLKLFSSKGEVRTLIARASTVILDQVTNEINEENEKCNGHPAHEDIGPFEKVSTSENNDDDEITCHC
ncbi:MAG: hypothetical protein JW787_12400 [Sedimentisphaerales bacterium]|nr:hypothetical protein [Sedimentisphaerales bacterium]